MKIVVPLVDGLLSDHFGHCEEFAVIKTHPEGNGVQSIRRVKPPPHEPSVLPRWLRAQGANVIIAGGMGLKARQMLSEHGISVVVGASSGTPEALVASYLGGTLEIGENACDHGSGEPSGDQSGCQHHRTHDTRPRAEMEK